MPIPMQCPCGSKLSVRDAAAGKVVECVSCGKRLRVPQPRAAAAAASSSAGGASAGGIIAGLLVALGAVGAVYFLMNKRVTQLEADLSASQAAAVAGQKSDEDARKVLMDRALEEQKRAQSAEDVLRAKVDAQRTRYESLDSEFQAAQAKRNAIAADVAEHEAKLAEAKAKGLKTDMQVRQLEKNLGTLKTELEAKTAEQDALAKNLLDTRQELDDLEQKFLAAVQQNATLIDKLQTDHARDMATVTADLAMQKANVTNLETQLAAASAADRAAVQKRLDAANARLARLERKSKSSVNLGQVIRTIGTVAGGIAGIAGRPGILRPGGVRRPGAAGVTQQPFMTAVAIFGGNTATIRIDTRTGAARLAVVTSGSGVPVKRPIARATSRPATAGRAGRYEVHFTYGAGNVLFDTVRLDTQTGQLWRLNAVSLRWTFLPAIHVTTPKPVKTWTFAVGNRRTPFPNIVLTDSASGLVWSDFWTVTPRFLWPMNGP